MWTRFGQEGPQQIRQQPTKGVRKVGEKHVAQPRGIELRVFGQYLLQVGGPSARVSDDKNGIALLFFLDEEQKAIVEQNKWPVEYAHQDYKDELGQKVERRQGAEAPVGIENGLGMRSQKRVHEEIHVVSPLKKNAHNWRFGFGMERFSPTAIFCKHTLCQRKVGLDHVLSNAKGRNYVHAIVGSSWPTGSAWR